MDCSKISLTKSELKAFQQYVKKKSIPGVKAPAALIHYRLVLPNYVCDDGQGGYISDGYRFNEEIGLIYLEYLKTQRSALRRESFRFWFPVLISLASLAVSLCAFLRGQS